MARQPPRSKRSGLTSVLEVTAEQERPVLFSNGAETLFGILTEPATAARGVGIVMLSGGVHVPSANRNRVWVRLARRLAGAGFHVLRFDYRGVGESGGATEAYSRESPRSEDFLGAVDCLRRQGLERVVVVGTCFGSFTALITAPRVAGLEGLVLLSPLILDSKSSAELATRRSLIQYVVRVFKPRVIRGLLSAKTRSTYARIARAKAEVLRTRHGAGAGEKAMSLLPTSPRVLRALQILLRAGTPVFVIFGSKDVHYEDWTRASVGRLGEILDGATSFETAVLPGYLHSFPELCVQEEAIALTHRWICLKYDTELSAASVITEH